jgi:hypothetical protein
MELTHDWKSFRNLFYPQRRANGGAERDANLPAYLIVENDRVVAAFADHEDLSDWVGAPLEEAQSRLAHRKLVAFDRAQVDQWIQGAVALPHFYDQVEYLKTRAKPMAGGPLEFRRHFLLEALHGWWGKVLPSAYGIFIRVEAEAGKPSPQDQEFLLIVRRGNFEGFIRPDLSSLSPDRRRQPEAVVRYLSEKHLVPVQGMYVNASEWNAWSLQGEPWRDVARSIKAQRTRMVPFRWSLAALVTTRGLLGV